MTLTNGQNRSFEFQREQKRQGLEALRTKTSKAFVETVKLVPPRPELVSGEALRRLMLQHFSLLEGLTVWNLGAEFRPEIASKSQFEPLSVRARKRLTGLAEGYKNVCERWSLDDLGVARLLHLEEDSGLCGLILSGRVPPMTGDLKDRMAFVIGISLGLGELFDDDEDAEVQWLNAPRDELGGISPLKHMLKGDLLNVREIADLVDKARGLR